MATFCTAQSNNVRKIYDTNRQDPLQSAFPQILTCFGFCLLHVIKQPFLHDGLGQLCRVGLSPLLYISTYVYICTDGSCPIWQCKASYIILYEPHQNLTRAFCMPAIQTQLCLLFGAFSELQLRRIFGDKILALLLSNFLHKQGFRLLLESPQ